MSQLPCCWTSFYLVQVVLDLLKNRISSNYDLIIRLYITSGYFLYEVIMQKYTRNQSFEKISFLKKWRKPDRLLLFSDIFTSYCEKCTTIVKEFVPNLLTRNNTKVLTRSIGFTSMNDFFPMTDQFYIKYQNRILNSGLIRLNPHIGITCTLVQNCLHHNFKSS